MLFNNYIFFKKCVNCVTANLCATTFFTGVDAVGWFVAEIEVYQLINPIVTNVNSGQFIKVIKIINYIYILLSSGLEESIILTSDEATALYDRSYFDSAQLYIEHQEMVNIDIDLNYKLQNL